MNENLDLTKILEGCPKGTEFYSTIYGEVEFDGIEEAPYEVAFMTNRKTPITFTPSGKYIELFDGECTIFPSRTQRDWSKFERFWDKSKVERFNPKTLQPFDKILARDCQDERWSIEFFSHKIGNVVRGLYSNWMYAIPYNEKTKHLIGTTDDCPEYYKWWDK